MVFAGEVFPEWYWGPIFFVVLFGPVLVAAAFVADFAVRRWVRPLRWGQRARLWAGVIAVGTLLIFGGRAVREQQRFDREAHAAARGLDFTPLAPSPLPDVFSEQLVRADSHFGAPQIVSRYGAGSRGFAFAYQQRAPALVSLQDGRCMLRPLVGTATNFFDGPCRELRTPRGRAVFIGASETVVDGGEAFALLDGTLVRLEHVRVADPDVLAFFDSLRPVAPDELDVTRG